MSAEAALREMRLFAEHDTDCIFALDLSGVNGDEFQGKNARRCSCGFDYALALYDAALASPESRTLDVETLARAIQAVRWPGGARHGRPVSPDHYGEASKVAAEYDRLREQPEGDPR